MYRSLLLSFALCFATTASLQAGFSLNPIKWFSPEKEKNLTAYNVPTTSEETEADELLKRGKYKVDSGNSGEAGKLFKKIAKNYPTTKAAGEALYLRSRIMMEKKRWIQAFQLLQQIIDKHQNYPNFDQVTAAQFECATNLMEGVRRKLFRVIPTFKTYNKSITFFEMIVENGPYSDYAPLSLMNIALVAEKMKDSKVTIDALDRIISYYPQSILAPDAYHKLAKTYATLGQSHEYDQGATQQGISYCEDFLALFPENENVGEVESNLKKMENTLAKSRVEVGDFYYLHRNNNTAALAFYNEAITMAPESESAAEAKKRIADIDAGIRPVRRSRKSLCSIFSGN